LQVALQFRFALRPVYQALSLTCSGVEIASQAEYAGSIPVIGSTVIRSTQTDFNGIVSRRI
jgi:hypothetical protein